MGETTTRIAAIREFFKDGPRPLTIGEMKRLSASDRAELGDLCAEALGKEVSAKAVDENKA